MMSMYYNKIVPLTTLAIVITALLDIIPLGAQNGSFRKLLEEDSTESVGLSAK